jgi:hypothetical protein
LSTLTREKRNSVKTYPHELWTNAAHSVHISYLPFP